MIIEVARNLDIQGIRVARVPLTFCIARGAAAQIIFLVLRRKQIAIRYRLRLYFNLLRTLVNFGIFLERLYTTILERDDILSQELSREWSVFPFLMLDLKLFRDSSLVNRYGS
jgi:hypothetical protein